MSGYEKIVAVSGEYEVIIPLAVSAFCALFDNQLTPASRNVLINKVVEYLRNNPQGISSAPESK